MTNNAMTGQDSVPSGKATRLVLLGLGLGMVAMLAALLVYRLGDKGALVRPLPPQIAAQQSQPAPTQGSMPNMSSGAMQSGMSMPEMDESSQAAMIAQMSLLQEDPNNIEAMLTLADVFMEQGNLANAQGFINRAMVAKPTDARPAYYLGVLKARQEDWPGAAEAMERSLSLQDSAATRYSLAVIYIYHLQNSERGKEHLQAAAQSPDLNPELKALIEAELQEQ